MAAERRASARIEYKSSKKSAAKIARLEEIKAKNKARFESLDDTYIICNKFSGKEKSHICFAPKTLIVTSIVIPVMIILNIISEFETAIKAIIIEIICVILFFRNRIKVTRKGVLYHKEFFPWEEIKTIGIAVAKNGLPHKFYKIIYISKRQHNKPVYLYDPRLYIKNREYENIETVYYVSGRPEYIIPASFNRRLIHHIMAYWGTDIKNLNDTKGWYSYVRFYNFIHRNKREAR